MAKEITDAQYNKLVASLKKNPGNSERFYAEASGIPQGQIASVLYKAELEADPKLKIPATGASVVKARNAGVRWPRIAAYANISVAKAKQLFEEGGGGKASESWTGRGRRTFSGASAPTARGGATRSSGPRTGSSGRRGAAKPKPGGTAGRGARGTQKPAGRGSRGTRAQADPK